MKKIFDYLLSLCTLPVLGMILTANYFLFIYWLFYDRFFQLKEIPLNEIGDFLAGAFGPIAFLWLVIGYLMQSSELKNSTLESKKAHDLARNQLDFQKSIRSEEDRRLYNSNQPQLEFLKIDDSNFPVVTIVFINKGSTITEFHANCRNRIDTLITIPITFESISNNQTVTAKLNLHYSIYEECDVAAGKRHSFIHQVSFYDGLKTYQTTTFTVHIFTNKEHFKPKGSFEKTYISGRLNGY